MLGGSDIITSGKTSMADRDMTYTKASNVQIIWKDIETACTANGDTFTRVELCTLKANFDGFPAGQFKEDMLFIISLFASFHEVVSACTLYPPEAGISGHSSRGILLYHRKDQNMS
jgi:hypothetical protein